MGKPFNFPPIEGTVLGAVLPTSLPDDLRGFFKALGVPDTSGREKRLNWQRAYEQRKKLKHG